MREKELLIYSVLEPQLDRTRPLLTPEGWLQKLAQLRSAGRNTFMRVCEYVSHLVGVAGLLSFAR